MIQVNSNNFGADYIDFRTFEKTGLVVVNARFFFNPSNEAYRSASVLEIKVSDMGLAKSTNAVVYLVDRENEMPHATILKAWIKDCNTICIEPCRCFDERPMLDIIFCSGFVAKGYRSELEVDEAIRPTVTASAGTFTLESSKAYRQLFIKDNKWGFIVLNFSKFQAAELNQEFSFIVPELPDNVDSWGVVVIDENYQDVGSPVCICKVTGQSVHCTPIVSPYNYGNDGRFMIMWFVLNAE